MRSYIDHLQSTSSSSNFYGVFRASAIFAAIEKEGISSRILFMGYWMMKRGIAEIGCVATLRAHDGTLLKRTYQKITEPKAFRIEAKELLPTELKNTDFEGSLEVEFFSSSNLVFPYPAAVINYYGPAFSTVVHTAQRVYNNFEDQAKNSETKVKESGFNLLDGASSTIKSFATYVNGPISQPLRTLSIEAYNLKNEMVKKEIDLPELKPYETLWIYPADLINSPDFFEEKVGACKLGFELKGVFPRLVAGNINTNPPALSITHTYYDCSEACSYKDYWHEESPLYHTASLMVPVDLVAGAFTNVYFYPIYSPSYFAIDLEVYDLSGKLVLEKKEVLKIGLSKDHFQTLRFDELGLPQGKYGARLIGRKLDDSPLPARIKLAVDMGFENPATPCNICTNLQPYTAKIADKPSSFKWAPVLADQPKSTLWMFNSSPEINYTQPATIDLKFHREMDNAVLERPIILPPHGHIEIETDKDPELVNFFDGKVGWATMVSSNPFLTTYYFAINPSGYVGGDHGF